MPFFDCYREIIPDFTLFQDRLRDPLPTHLRVNRLKAEPAFVIENLRSGNIRVERVLETDDCLLVAPGLENPGNLIEYSLGYIHIQALTSCLAALALNPSENSLVLDLCASPGGKTSHMAQIMRNSGLIVANELYSRRRIPLGHTLARLGVLNTLITGYPAQEFPLRQSFDYVLLDVPCSGEGRFRMTRPFSRYEERGRKSRLHTLQRRAILRAFDLLKAGGEMVYSTCTYDPGENESVVDYLMKNRPAELLPVDVGVKPEPGVRLWKGEVYDTRMERTARFYPHRINSVGFFVARICRGRKPL